MPTTDTNANAAESVLTQNKYKKNVVIGAGIIIIIVAAISAVSSFMIYREGFSDLGWWPQHVMALFAVAVVEGAFAMLVYGFARAFASKWERWVALAGICFAVFTMFTNVVTHFMMVKGAPLNSFQENWLGWGAVTVFIVILIIFLVLTMVDPVVQLAVAQLQLLISDIESKLMIKQQIVNAKRSAKDSEEVKKALSELMAAESRQLAAQIAADAKGLPSAASPGLPPATATAQQPATPQQRPRFGFAAQDQSDPKS